MRKILVGGCLGLALALMVGSGVALASPEVVKYESVQLAALDCVAVAQDVESALAVRQGHTVDHDFMVAANFRKEGAGIVLTGVKLVTGPGDGDTGPYS
jgi:hypothetical protein